MISFQSSVLRSALREKEAYINSFKRELSSLIVLKASKIHDEGNLQYFDPHSSLPRSSSSSHVIEHPHEPPSPVCHSNFPRICCQNPKEVEDAVKDCYQRFVREEAPRRRRAPATTATLPTTATTGPRDDLDREFDLEPRGAAADADMAMALREAYSQRDCVEKLKDDLVRRLETTKKEAAKSELRKVGPNFMPSESLGRRVSRRFVFQAGRKQQTDDGVQRAPRRKCHPASECRPPEAG